MSKASASSSSGLPNDREITLYLAPSQGAHSTKNKADIFVAPPTSSHELESRYEFLQELADQLRSRSGDTQSGTGVGATVPTCTVADESEIRAAAETVKQKFPDLSKWNLVCKDISKMDLASEPKNLSTYRSSRSPGTTDDDRKISLLILLPSLGADYDENHRPTILGLPSADHNSSVSMGRDHRSRLTDELAKRIQITKLGSEKQLDFAHKHQSVQKDEAREHALSVTMSIYKAWGNVRRELPDESKGWCVDTDWAYMKSGVSD